MHSRATGRRARYAGVTAVVALAACGSNTPTQPFSPLTLTLSSSEVSPTETDTLSFGWVGQTPPLTAIIGVSGILTGADTIHVPDFATGVTLTMTVPRGTPNGIVNISVELPSLHERGTTQLTVKDTIPPQMMTQLDEVVPFGIPDPYGTQIMPFSSMQWLEAGGLDTLWVWASDAGTIASVGYAIGPPANVRDSVVYNDANPLQDTAVVAQIPLTISTAWLGSAPTLSIFVHDAAGNTNTFAWGNAPVFHVVNRPTTTLPLPAPPRDVAFDTKRGVAYISEPTAQSIAVVSLANRALQTPIALTGQPLGLDIRPGGDTLIVALAGTKNVALIDLSGGSPVTQIVPLQFMQDSNVAYGASGTGTVDSIILPTVENVRVGADGRALISLSHLSVAVADKPQDNLVELDPDGSQHVALTGAQWDWFPLGRSFDGTKILIMNVGINGAGPTWLYDDVAHTYTAVNTNGPVPNYPYGASGDQTGSLWASIDSVYNGAVTSVGFVNMVTWGSITQTMSPAGDYYEPYSTYACSLAPEQNLPPCGVYMRFIVPVHISNPDSLSIAGQLLEIVQTPIAFNMMAISPDGLSAIGCDSNSVSIVDLKDADAPPWTRRVNSHASTLTFRPRRVGSRVVASLAKGSPPALRSPTADVSQAERSTRTGPRPDAEFPFGIKVSFKRH